MSLFEASKKDCLPCLSYNWNRAGFYIILTVISIASMGGVDYLLSDRNPYFNTYAMMAQLIDPNGSYQYLWSQDEIDHSLAVALMMLVTLHILFALFLFHIIQWVYLLQNGELLQFNGKQQSDAMKVTYSKPSYPLNALDHDSGESADSMHSALGHSISSGAGTDIMDNDFDHPLHTAHSPTDILRKQRNQNYASLPTPKVTPSLRAVDTYHGGGTMATIGALESITGH